jgi:transposase-like protein
MTRPIFVKQCQVENACYEVGIGRSTFYRWLQRARESGASEKFKQFLATVNAAKEAKKAASSVLSSAPASGKLSSGTLCTICDLLKDGLCTVESACALAGVGRTTLYRWLDQARDPLAPPKFKDLAIAIESARTAPRVVLGSCSQNNQSLIFSRSSLFSDSHAVSDALTEMNTGRVRGSEASLSPPSEARLPQPLDAITAEHVCNLVLVLRELVGVAMLFFPQRCRDALSSCSPQ